MCFNNITFTLIKITLIKYTLMLNKCGLYTGFNVEKIELCR